MRVSILIMAFLPPFRALTSASSARVAASLHWASSSFLSFSRFMASSCSQRSSSARRAASTMGVLLDGGLGLSVASNGVLKSQTKVSSVSLELLLHPESLSLALGLGLKGNLHGVEGLGLSLLDEDELLLLLGKAALDLLPDGVELQLTPQHLVLLLLEGGLGLLQGRLELHLLGLKALPDFVNLVDGASTLADLVHDVLDLVGESLVLPADLLQLEHGLLVGRLHLEHPC